MNNWLFNISPINLFYSLNVVQSKWLISLKNILMTMYFFFNNTETQLKFFSDLLTVDFPIYILRYLCIYNIISMVYNIRFFFKTILGINNTVESVTNSYVCASWFERESWDLFGVFFLNNLDLRRILNDYGFFGHPLKKDFPLSGFLEVYVYFFINLVFYGNIKMNNAFRNYSLTSPWKVLVSIL